MARTLIGGWHPGAGPGPTLATCVAAALLVATAPASLLAAAPAPRPVPAAPATLGELLQSPPPTGRTVSVVVRLKAAEGKAGKEGRRDEASVAAAGRKLQEGLKGTGSRVKRLFRYVPYATLELDAGALRRLASLDVVAGVSAESEYRPLASFDSTALVGESWSFKQAYSGRGAAVAILDGGTVRHPYFADRIAHEFCFSSPSSESRSLCRAGAAEDSGPGSACAFPEFCDHGTHVTGIVAGNDPSRTGVAPGADVIVVNASVEKWTFLGERYHTFLTGDMVAGLEKVLDLTDELNVASVNMSIGGDPRSEGPCDAATENQTAMKAVVDLLRQKGVATVVASGNDGEKGKMTAPACISSVVAVGAIDSARHLADFSNSSPLLAFLAPGVDVVSSVVGGFGPDSGTSMAAPHVAGAWAVLKAEKPAATVDQVESALKRSGLLLTDPRQGRKTPLIQVEEALHLLLLPQVLLFPSNGTYLSPLEVQVDTLDRLQARDLKTWATTNGELPVENGPGSTLVCSGNGCGFNSLTLGHHGGFLVLARAFFSLLDGTRASSDTSFAFYDVKEPAPGPASVQASDGTFPDRVRVTWTPVPGADGYDVFATANGRTPGPSVPPLHPSPATATTFDHFPGVGTGEVLTYFVRGRVDGFPTLFGPADTGFARAAAILVSASDGTDPRGVHLTWDPVPWKTPGLHVVYEVYRGTDADPAHAALVATLGGTFVNHYPAGVVVRPAPREYLDDSAGPGQTYFYWVKGIDAGDVSRMGDGESGFRAPP